MQMGEQCVKVGGVKSAIKVSEEGSLGRVLKYD